MVELMVVLIFIGALSSVGLPILLKQQDKAKTTEAQNKISTILRQSYAEYQLNNDENDAIISALTNSLRANQSGKFSYSPYKAGKLLAQKITSASDGIDLVPADILIIGADPANAANKDQNLIKASTNAPLISGKIFGCINLVTGKTDIKRDFKNAITPNADGIVQTSTIAGLDCQ